MKKLTFLIIFLTAIAISCSKRNSCPKDSFDYFSTHLAKDMDYDALVKTFGSPDEEVGSGIHIYVYKLCDSTSVMIGYTDKILYARHVDSNQLLLHTIF